MEADFHRMSDGKGPTVTLFKIMDNNQCVGGFTSAQWASLESADFISDSTAMLFNLSTRNIFKPRDETIAIQCGKDRGPCFGIYELLSSEPFNGNKKCSSYVNSDGYYITMDSEFKSNLTNVECQYGLSKYNSEFTISELEVWEIIFEK